MAISLARTAAPSSAPRVLADLTQPAAPDIASMSKEQLLALVAQLAAQASAPHPRGISYRVSEKGAVSICGLRQFPITLYVGELDRIIADLDNLNTFLAANRSRLATKPAKA